MDERVKGRTGRRTNKKRLLAVTCFRLAAGRRLNPILSERDREAGALEPEAPPPQ